MLCLPRAAGRIARRASFCAPGEAAEATAPPRGAATGGAREAGRPGVAPLRLDPRSPKAGV